MLHKSRGKFIYAKKIIKVRLRKQNYVSLAGDVVL